MSASKQRKKDPTLPPVTFQPNNSNSNSNKNNSNNSNKSSNNSNNNSNMSTSLGTQQARAKGVDLMPELPGFMTRRQRLDSKPTNKKIPTEVLCIKKETIDNFLFPPSFVGSCEKEKEDEEDPTLTIVPGVTKRGRRESRLDRSRRTIGTFEKASQKDIAGLSDHRIHVYGLETVQHKQLSQSLADVRCILQRTKYEKELSIRSTIQEILCKRHTN